jgi:starch phosphorylase
VAVQIEITREIGEQNIFLFGTLAEDVEELRHRHFYGDFQLDPHLAKVFEAIRSDMFGDASNFSALMSAIAEHGDYYLVSDDFNSYVTTQEIVDEAFKNQDEWIAKSITSVARMGFFSTDRVISEYADSIWNIEPLEVRDD